MDDKTEKKLRRLLAIMDEDTLTRDEFVQAFEQVTETVVSIDKRNTEGQERLNKSIDAALQSLQQDNGATLSDVRAEINKILEKALEDQRNSLNFIHEKVRLLRDGKDADEKRVIRNAVDEVLAQIKLPEIKDPILDTPIELRNKLESLEGVDRLDASAIKGLRNELKGLAKEIKTLKTGAVGRIEGPGTVKYHDASADLDGAAKTFYMPAFARIVQVNLSSFPNILRPITDFTWDGNAGTITFTSEIDAASSLSAGQTLIILYAET